MNARNRDLTRAAFRASVEGHWVLEAPRNPWFRVYQPEKVCLCFLCL
jgi:hypothetical protein